jgi:alpha-glucosidase
VRPLFFEFPTESDLLNVDTQFLIGRDVLVTPVLLPNATAVTGFFPGSATGTIWRDWYTHSVLSAPNGTALLDAPLGTISVHLRDGSALLLFKEPKYTTTETAAGPFELLVHLSSDGSASGTAYIDDGISDPPGPATELAFAATNGTLAIAPAGAFNVTSKLDTITLLGVASQPETVQVGQQNVNFTYDADVQRVVVSGLDVDLNTNASVSWA